VRSSFSQYVVHGLLSSSGSDLHISYPVFPRDAQYTPLSFVMCSIQAFVNVAVNDHTPAEISVSLGISFKKLHLIEVVAFA